MDLREWDKPYREAKCDTRSALPDGDYQVRVLRVELKQTKTTGAPMMAWELEILGPSHIGRRLYKNSVISTNSIQFLKKDLETAGLSLQSFSDLPKRIHELLDLVIEVTKKSDKNDPDRSNVYFNKRVVVDDDAQAQMPEIPF